MSLSKNWGFGPVMVTAKSPLWIEGSFDWRHCAWSLWTEKLLKQGNNERQISGIMYLVTLYVKSGAAVVDKILSIWKMQIWGKKHFWTSENWKKKLFPLTGWLTQNIIQQHIL